MSEFSVKASVAQDAFNGTFAGYFSMVRYVSAVALVVYLFDRSHSWYAGFLKIFILVQGLTAMISKLTAFSW